MPNIGGSNKLLTVSQLAEYLVVPESTIYDCWRDWGLEAYRVGRALRFRERAVEKWLDSRRVG